MRRIVSIGLLAATAWLANGCSFHQVLTDFHIIKPDTSQTQTDKQQRIEAEVKIMAPQEMVRLDQLPESSRVIFVRDADSPAQTGEFMRLQRRFDSYRLDSITQRKVRQDASRKEQGYDVVVTYRYRENHSLKFTTREEATLAAANLQSPDLEDVTLKYLFDLNGQWDGQPGKATSKR